MPAIGTKFNLNEFQKLSKPGKISKSLGYAKKKTALMQGLPTKCEARLTLANSMVIPLAVFLRQLLPSIRSIWTQEAHIYTNTQPTTM